MTLLVVGLNHRTSSVEVLERAVAATTGGKVAADLAESPHVGESAILSTCNRVELYADVPRFHPGVAELTGVLERHSGVSRDELAASLYVHYEDRAIQHLFGVACGLDSMVVGEPQILGQVRQAMRAAEEAGTLAAALGEPFRRALRAGKRARSETGIDAAGGSLVTVALDLVAESTGDLAGRRALVVGAGAMGSLSVAALTRRGADVVVANRSLAPARRLARDYGGRAVELAGLPAEMAAADVVVTCTGATGVVVTRAEVAPALSGRPGRPLFLVDLAVPRDVAADVHELPGVHVVGLDKLVADETDSAEVAAVRRIVAEEADAFRASVEQARVAPTVAALRGVAARVVEAELERLRGKAPGLDERSRAEVERTVHRIVDKLLHTPTVRVKELASGPDGGSYAAMLRQLFDLDPAETEAVAAPDPDLEAGDMGTRVPLTPLSGHEGAPHTLPEAGL